MQEEQILNLTQTEAVAENFGRVVVVGQEAGLASLQAGALRSNVRFVPAEPYEALTSDIVSGADILVCQIDPTSDRSLRRIEMAREIDPSTALIVALNDASVGLVKALLRQGVRDVVAYPFDERELTEAILNCSAELTNRRQEAPLAPLFVVARSKGGCGSTSIATHLAANLADRGPTNRGCCLFDLDVQFGAVSSYLGINVRHDVCELLDAEGRMDEDLLRSVSTKTGNLSVVSAPDKIVPLESVQTDQLLRALDLARQNYDFVVLDLPSNWTDWALSALVAATSVLLVTELNLASLRQAKRRLELFDSIGVPRSAIRLVVNRVEKQLFRSIGLEDVERALHHSVISSVALDREVLSSAQDQGILVDDINRKSKFAKSIKALADAMLDQGRGS